MRKEWNRSALGGRTGRVAVRFSVRGDANPAQIWGLNGSRLSKKWTGAEMRRPAGLRFRPFRPASQMGRPAGVALIHKI